MAKSASVDDKILVDVIDKLENKDKPITKKLACQMLGITYNTTRLKKLIENYKAQLIAEKAIKAKMRKTPLSALDKKAIVEGAIEGDSITSIAKTSYRSAAVVKRVLEEYNIPKKSSGSTYFKDVPLLALESIREDYRPGDIVYSARYGCVAEIVFRAKDSKEHGAVYNIYLLGKEQQRAYQPFYELADLTKAQKELNIKINVPEGISGNGHLRIK